MIHCTFADHSAATLQYAHGEDPTALGVKAQCKPVVIPVVIPVVRLVVRPVVRTETSTNNTHKHYKSQDRQRTDGRE